MKKLYCLLFIGLVACDVFDKDEPIPGYVYIDRADLNVAGDGSEGANTADIVDAHVFANDIFVGTIELPGRVPILEEGPTRITVGAGIRNNGITANRIIYPFYRFTETQVELIPDTEVPIDADSSLEFNYFESPGLIRILLEEFEGVGNIWEPAQSGGVGVTNTSADDEILTGFGSGKIALDADNPSVEVYSSQDAWNLAGISPGLPVYLELDYRGNNPLEIGIRALSPSPRKIFALGLNPTDEWSKVYVELTNEVASAQTNNLQVYLESEKVVNDPLVEIFLDNMKLVYVD